ncbi:hypothetical protein [Tsukamurella sp. USMM236]|uniref:hypothetical protein n=1 Tax=Tsukamurella sp. USMM236 TaxID=3081301 RepID=UPI00301AFB09
MSTADEVPHAGRRGMRESVTGRGDLTEVHERAAVRGAPGRPRIRRIVDHVNQIDHA